MPDDEQKSGSKSKSKPKGSNDKKKQDQDKKKKEGSDEDKSASPATTSAWVIVLGTFTDKNHETAAANMLQNLPLIAPGIKGARVHTTAKGSMVVYGNYKDRDDPQAKTDQERIKAIMYRGKPVFNRAIVTRIDLTPPNAPLQPNDLRNARRAHPKVDPLYTLDIALWDDFDSGQMKYEEIRKKAETYAKELRARGLEAYFYHDDANERSVVTVGLFDHRAIHAQSGIMSAEVEALLRKFPQRMVNGEPFSELVDEHRPDLGTRPQKPKLALVPME